MDILDYNKRAWDRAVTEGNRWTIPVTSGQIAEARKGNWAVVLTPTRAVPLDWFPHRNGMLTGVKLLALASGGGQQAPLFSAAGAEVTLFDNSPAQLDQDRKVAQRDSLKMNFVEGDMRDLSAFSDESFDFIFHPCSNCFVPEIEPVWREAYRVLRKGGAIVAGFTKPIVYLIDPELDKKGIAQLRYRAPYSDVTSLTDEERKRYTDKGEPLCFGHTLEQQIGGQLAAGFKLTGFFEDRWGETGDTPTLDQYLDSFIATRAVKE